MLQFSILVLAGVVMGGSGNIAGAILGGALISYIPDRLRGIQDPVFHTDLFELPVRDLRPGDHRDHDLPSAGSDPEPAPGDGAQGPGQGGGSASERSAGTIESAERPELGRTIVMTRRTRVARALDAPTRGPWTGRNRPPAPRGAGNAPMRRQALLEVDDVTLRFGGVVALNDVSFTPAQGRDLRADRPERRRQDDLLQRDDRGLPADQRGDPVPGRVDRRARRSTRSPGAASPGRSRTCGCSRR